MYLQAVLLSSHFMLLTLNIIAVWHFTLYAGVPLSNICCLVAVLPRSLRMVIDQIQMGGQFVLRTTNELLESNTISNPYLLACMIISRNSRPAIEVDVHLTLILCK